MAAAWAEVESALLPTLHDDMQTDNRAFQQNLSTSMRSSTEHAAVKKIEVERTHADKGEWVRERPVESTGCSAVTSMYRSLICPLHLHTLRSPLTHPNAGSIVS